MTLVSFTRRQFVRIGAAMAAALFAPPVADLVAAPDRTPIAGATPLVIPPPPPDRPAPLTYVEIVPEPLFTREERSAVLRLVLQTADRLPSGEPWPMDILVNDGALIFYGPDRQTAEEAGGVITRRIFERLGRTTPTHTSRYWVRPRIACLRCGADVPPGNIEALCDDCWLREHPEALDEPFGAAS